MNEIKLGKEMRFSRNQKKVIFYAYYLVSKSYEYFNTEAERSQYIANHKLIINLKSENYA